MRALLSAASSVLMALFLATAALAQEPSRPSARITRASSPPAIDGRLDEPCWSVPTIGPLIQMEPLIAQPATEPTEVRLLFDDDNVYIGVRCFDREPSKIVATQMSRDAELDPDDRLEIIVDTFHDRRTAFYFQMSAAGSKGDALMSRNGGTFNKPWDGIWEGKVTIDDLGWSCEIALPLKTLAFDPSGDTWGFNINRVIKRKLENDRWSGLRQDASFFRTSDAGDIHGLAGLKPGVGLDFVPYFHADWTNDRVDDEEHALGKAGFDLFYRLTPSLQASFTYNTDFAETEVDDRRINLTRFPLFFPEKRDFFLQDAGAFEFAEQDTTLVPFFSRRIGLDDQGNEVPILFGTKLTGHAADWNVGLLDVQTDATSTLDSENLAVARVSKNVGEQSTIGGIFTNGDPTSSGSSQLYGLDANFRTSSAFGSKNLTASAWGLKTQSDETSGDDAAYGAAVAFPNDIWSARVSAREVQENFDPALGFVQRRGVRQYAGNVGFEPRIDKEIRRLEFALDAHVTTNLDDRLQTFEGSATVLGIVWDSGDEAALSVRPTEDRLDGPFEIREGIVIPTDDYTYVRYRADFESSLKRPVSGAVGFETGEFYDGMRDDVLVSLAWRPGPHFTGSVDYERSDVELDEGSFTTHLGRVRLDFAFTTDVTWSNFVQFDNESDSLGAQSRLRWILEPGSDIFLVFGETLVRDDGSVHATDQELAFKVVYTVRF
jgi:hypothetical protein